MSDTRTRTWPPYDESARCPKCGHRDVGSLWRDGWVYKFPLSREGEWIERSCRRCHYCWPEECVPSTTSDTATISVTVSATETTEEGQ